MSRLVPVLLLLAAGGAVAWLLLGDPGAPGDVGPRSQQEEEAEPDRPPPLVLEARPGDSPRAARGGEVAPSGAGGRGPPGEREDEGETFLEGTVVTEEGGAPIEGAWVWLERHADPCPRLPLEGPPARWGLSQEDALALAFRPPRGPHERSAVTDASGRFRMRAGPGWQPASGSLDLFVGAAGRITEVRCAVEVPGELRLALREGLALAGTVVDRRLRPVQGARVRAVPAPSSPTHPGHASLDVFPPTDEEGRFALAGLAQGEVLLEVEHPHFAPFRGGPYEPGGPEVVLLLTPALRVTLALRTDDARDPEHATVLWRSVDGKQSGVFLLACTRPEEDAEGQVTCAPVRLPCVASHATLEVKAEGYATWRSEAIECPRDGGEIEIEVELRNDRSGGTVRVTLEDEAGQHLDARTTVGDVRIQRLDPGTATTYVLEPREDLHITSLPSGTYRMQVLGAPFAPAQADVTVVPGEEAHVLLRVRPAARLRVRFFGPERRIVRFRLTQGGQVVFPVPEGAALRGVDEASGEPVLAAGEDGLLLAGLASGTYQVEVLSEDLVAPATVVRLREGDTEEVEVHVSPR